MPNQQDFLNKMLSDIEQERYRSDKDRQRITTLESDQKHMMKDLHAVTKRLDALIEEQKRTNEVLTRW
ncbi:hypothetical protein [Pleionea sp. CnH1-48]|uniref:hypothetical protein n=1 Tax=Pleionea sp. CnH1-48 TaxID=2954494 RepID=UPI0020980875|nr:hypothetical protein [Pleionea sp. CnH1-48]MCO7225914.1 hypothetical protein [Pleionea sp. CnH1-48]